MSVIRVDPDELNSVAGQINASMRDMDQALRHAHQQLSGIRDRAKGLDDIRSRASNLYRLHTNLMQDGAHVQQHIVQSAVRFGENDRNLASMIAQNAGAQQSLWQQMLNASVIAGATLNDALSGVQNLINGFQHHAGTALSMFAQYAGMIGKFTRKEVLDYLKSVGNNLDLASKLFGIHAGFKGKLTEVYKMVKDLIPHGNSTLGKAIRWMGNAAKWAEYIKSGVDIAGTFVNDIKTGNFWNTYDKATDIAANFLTKTLVTASVAFAGKVFLGAVGVGAAVVVAKPAAIVLLAIGATYGTSMLVQSVGSGIASGYELFGNKEKADNIRESLKQWDLVEKTKNGVKWLIKDGSVMITEKINQTVDSATQGVISFYRNPQAHVQRFVNFVDHTKQQVTESVINTANQVKEVVVNTTNKVKEVSKPIYDWAVENKIPEKIGDLYDIFKRYPPPVCHVNLGIVAPKPFPCTLPGNPPIVWN